MKVTRDMAALLLETVAAHLQTIAHYLMRLAQKVSPGPMTGRPTPSPPDDASLV